MALNAMLERLEQAFREREASENRLRQFLADASHELRTPLASIRGYAELFRMGAARSDADKDKAMRRIEEEATRMGILVEDLLTLARLDEVQDLAREEIDLRPLASDAVADARATDPGRSIELRADEPAVVFGTAHQLRQVFAQPDAQCTRPHAARNPDRGLAPAGRRPRRADGSRPWPGAPDDGPRRPVRAVLARGEGPRAGRRGSGARSCDRRGHRRRTRRRGDRGERRGRRRPVRRPAARPRAGLRS